MISKADIINEAIRGHKRLSFDYVSSSRKISKDRLVEPVELAHTEKYGIKMWARDMKAARMLKQFDLEGIQEPKITEEGGEKI